MTPPTDPKFPPPADATRPPDSGEAAPRPRYDEEIKGNSFEVLRHYQNITLPPNARQNLLSAQLPAAELDQLYQDTLPPNGSVTASTAAPPSTPSVSTVAPVVDKSRKQATLLIPRVQRKRRLRVVVAAAVALAIVLLVVGVVVMGSRANSATDAAGQDEQSATPTGVRNPATVVPAAPKPKVAAELPASSKSPAPLEPAVTQEVTKPANSAAKPTHPTKLAPEMAPPGTQPRKSSAPVTTAPKAPGGLLGTELARPPAD